MARADSLKISGPVLNMLIVCHPLHSLEGLHEFKSDLQMKDPLFLTAGCGTAIRPTHLTAAMISTSPLLRRLKGLSPQVTSAPK